MSPAKASRPRSGTGAGRNTKPKVKKGKKKTLLLNVVSIKGGTGKSVLSLSFAMWLARRLSNQDRSGPDRVVYFDADFSGTCTRTGLGDDAFDRTRHSSRDEKRARYLEGLMQHIALGNLDSRSGEFFERFGAVSNNSTVAGGPSWSERLLLGFSSETPEAAYHFARFLDIERQTHLILTRLLSLASHALRDAQTGVVVLDNGPGIYGISMGLLNLDGDGVLNGMLANRGLGDGLGEVQTAHLFVGTPDRQDLDGTGNLLRIYSEKGKTLPYFIAVNCSRRGWDEIEIESMTPELMSNFQQIKDLEKRSAVLPDYHCLRLFSEVKHGGANLWDDENWKQHEREIESLAGKLFEPIWEDFSKR